MFAIGKNKQTNIPKELVVSTTAALESVLLNTTIDEHKFHYVATIDTPNEFNQAYIVDKFSTMWLRVMLEDRFSKNDPAIYLKYITIRTKVDSFLWILILKAFYGIIKTDLLFYLRILKGIKLNVFNLNPHGHCVVNKTIYGYQKTLVWHVENTNIYYNISMVMEEII